MERGTTSVAPLRTPPDTALSGGLLVVIDALATALVLLDERGNVLFANQRAAELLEGQPQALEREVVAGLLASAPAPSGAGARGVCRIQLPSGRQMDLGYTLSAVPQQASGASYALTFQDITEVLRLQEERDRLLKLATVGETLPSLLHELKNPLAAIASSVELLIEEAADPQLQKDLHAVLTEVRRTVISLDGIGSVGRELPSASLSAVDHAIVEACTVLKSRAARSNVQIVTDVPPLPLLYLEQSVVRAIVFNLVTNAIHACADGGKKILVQAQLEPGGESLLLSVSDDGCGMDPEVLRRCTDLFYSTKRSGSGIGLALVKRIVEQAGGSLEIESEPGRGTCVRLSVPLPRAGRPTPAPAFSTRIQ